MWTGSRYGRQGAMEKIKIDPEWDNLVKEAARARNAGVTYGVFKGRQYAREQEKILEKERRYAEYKARKERERRFRRAAKKAQTEREAREKAGTVCLAGVEEKAGAADGRAESAAPETPQGKMGENLRKCLGCGKVLTGNQRKYCSVRCEYLVHQEERKTARKEKYWEDHPRAGRKCAVCGAMLETRQKFYCSEGCARAARNGRRRKTEK